MCEGKSFHIPVTRKAKMRLYMRTIRTLFFRNDVRVPYFKVRVRYAYVILEGNVRSHLGKGATSNRRKSDGRNKQTDCGSDRDTETGCQR